MRNTYHYLRLLLLLILLSGNVTTTKAQRIQRNDVSLFATVAGGASYTGLNGYFNLGMAFGKHRLYAGPKMVLSKSYVPGRTLWGVNAGYFFSLMYQNRWNTSLNIDYQNTIYRSAPSVAANTLQEITGGFNVNYFVVEQKMSLGLTLGSGVRIENAYNTYTTDKSASSGAMFQVRLGLVYKLSRR